MTGTRRSPRRWHHIAIAGGAAAVMVAGSTVIAYAPGPVDPCHVNGTTYCVLNPAVTQATIKTTICVSGYTKTIRPAVAFTDALKRTQMTAQHLPGTPADYEEDHRMPLELGGAPSDPKNLAPESRSGVTPASLKDSAENAAKQKVCAGADLRKTQAEFVKTWLGPYPDRKSVV